MTRTLNVGVLTVIAATVFLFGCANHEAEKPAEETEATAAPHDSEDTHKAMRSDADVEMGVPDFTLEDQDGNEVSLSDFAGSVVVLEWINWDCPFVVRHYNESTMKTLADQYTDDGVVWLAINSTHYATQDKDREWIDKHDLPYPILHDPSGETGHAYDTKTTPHMYIIGRDGELVYEGAIDDDPRGNKDERVNYVRKALDELLAGEAVSTPETKPYGCTVKYAD